MTRKTTAAERKAEMERALALYRDAVITAARIDCLLGNKAKQAAGKNDA